jgi:hypothetical protein
VETGAALVPIEVRLSAILLPAMAADIQALRPGLGENCAAGFLVHGGSVHLPLGAAITAIPFGAL